MFALLTAREFFGNLRKTTKPDRSSSQRSLWKCPHSFASNVVGSAARSKSRRNIAQA